MAGRAKAQGPKGTFNKHISEWGINTRENAASDNRSSLPVANTWNWHSLVEKTREKKGFSYENPEKGGFDQENEKKLTG